MIKGMYYTYEVSGKIGFLLIVFLFVGVGVGGGGSFFKILNVFLYTPSLQCCYWVKAHLQVFPFTLMYM